MVSYHRRSIETLAEMFASGVAEISVSPTEFLRLSGVQRFEDGSGFNATLEVSVRTFEARCRPFYFDDLAEFVEDLNRSLELLTGTCVLKSRYEKDHLALTFGTLGHVSISGVLGEADGTNCVLRFRFSADQTYLQSFAKELQRIGQQLSG